MASGQNSVPQIIGTLLGAAAKELFKTTPPTNAGHYVPEDRRRNNNQNFKKNTRHVYPRSDCNSKKVVKTMEKLVDAKEEALSQEKIRRQKAELEVMQLQHQLKKVQLGDDRKGQVESTTKKYPYSGKSNHTRPDGMRGGGRGGFTKSGREGHYNRTSGKPGQSGPFELNNSKNINSECGGYKKVYNKQAFPTSQHCDPANFLAPQSNFPNQIQNSYGLKNAHRGRKENSTQKSQKNNTQ